MIRNFEKVNAGKRNRLCKMCGVTTSNRTVREGPIELVTFEQRIKGGERAGPMDIQGTNISGRGERKCKVLEEGTCPMCPESWRRSV